MHESLLLVTKLGLKFLSKIYCQTKKPPKEIFCSEISSFFLLCALPKSPQLLSLPTNCFEEKNIVEDMKDGAEKLSLDIVVAKEKAKNGIPKAKRNKKK